MGRRPVNGLILEQEAFFSGDGDFIAFEGDAFSCAGS